MEPTNVRGPAIAATALALALVNVGLAGLIAEAVGAHVIFPVWAVVAALLVGALAAGTAIVLWRAYLRGR